MQQEQEDDLGDHASANDKDPPKPSDSTPQPKPTQDTIPLNKKKDDCGDDSGGDGMAAVTAWAETFISETFRLKYCINIQHLGKH